MQNWNIAVTTFSKTPLLDTIRTPDDLRKLKIEQVRQVADELRQETIDAVSVTGGHFGAGLGVVELTTAIHYIFDTPRDRLIWDVGHQAYPHKILTGRRDRIRTLRTGGGLSGFTKRSESDYDPFGAAHSSTSISAGLGMAVARDLSGGKNNVIAVIGDGAMSAGMAYEAMNNAGAMNSRLIVILNDNDMSIAPPVGAMSAYLSRLYSGKTYRTLREAAKQINKHLPKIIANRANRVEEYSRGFMMDGGTLFEELGFYYVGPIDGHNLDHLLPVLKNVRDMEDRPDPGPRRDAEGQGLRPGGSFRRQVSRRGQVRRRHRRPGESQTERAGLPERVRPEPRQGSREGRQDRRHHRGDAVRHRHRHLQQGLSRPHLRRRHRRAACGDVCRRPCHRRLQAVLRDLLDLPAARLRPGRPRRGDPEPAGALRHRPRRPGRRRRRHPCRLVRQRLSRLPAQFRHHGGVRRGRAGAHGRDAGRDQRPPERAALSARRRPRRRDARSRRSRSRSARAASSARATRSRCCRSARVWPNAKRPPTNSPPTASPPRSPTPAS